MMTINYKRFTIIVFRDFELNDGGIVWEANYDRDEVFLECDEVFEDKDEAIFNAKYEINRYLKRR